VHCTACNLTLLQCWQYWVSFDNSCDWMWILNIFELFRTLLHLELFRTFLSFKLLSSNFTTMKKSAVSACEMFIYIYLSELSSQPACVYCSLFSPNWNTAIYKYPHFLTRYIQSTSSVYLMDTALLISAAICDEAPYQMLFIFQINNMQYQAFFPLSWFMIKEFPIGLLM